MMQRFPCRRTNIFDYWQPKKKFKYNIIDIPVTPISCLENLPNELICEIYEYLPLDQIYESFHDMNLRFRNLIVTSMPRLIVEVPHGSSEKLKLFNQNLILPYKKCIRTLRLSDPFAYRILFKPVCCVSHFIRLEYLVLDQIRSQYLLNTVRYLTKLPALKGLVLVTEDERNPFIVLLNKILACRALEYLKISSSQSITVHADSFYGFNKSSIQHLVLSMPIHGDSLAIILNHMPKLRRLACHLDEVADMNKSDLKKMIPDQIITHLSLNVLSVTFENLQPYIRRYFPRLKVFYLSLANDRDYLNASEWEKFIVKYLQNLRVLHFKFRFRISPNEDDQVERFRRIHQEFSSSFWQDRGWFFECQIEPETIYADVIFNSINPYKLREYTIYTESKIKTLLSNRCYNNVDSVRQLNITYGSSWAQYWTYFRNVTELRLSARSFHSNVSLLCELQGIISLTRLTSLSINIREFPFETLFDLLAFMPLIRSLEFSGKEVSESEARSWMTTPLFESIKTKNCISMLNTGSMTAVESIKLLLALCPTAKQLVISTRPRRTLEIIEHIFTLKKSQECQITCLKSNVWSMPRRSSIQRSLRFSSSTILSRNSLIRWGQHMYLCFDD